jgi:uncharacterized Zn-binding protein involved in type VI secretion
MPKVIRVYEGDKTQSHCWPSAIPKIGSTKVFANRFEIMRMGDQYNDHPGPCGEIPTHSVFAGAGSSDVFVENLPIHRDGDSCTCGDAADNGSDTVFANGGGGGGPGTSGTDPNETTGYIKLVPVLAYPQGVIMPYIGKRAPFPPHEWQFYSGCPYEINLIEVFTPMIEEGSRAQFKNFPGFPVTTQSGVKLPKYANKGLEAPEPIFKFELHSGALPKGATLDSVTGKITGTTTSDEYRKIEIKCWNKVGPSNIVQVTFSSKRVQEC